MHGGLKAALVLRFKGNLALAYLVLEAFLSAFTTESFDISHGCLNSNMLGEVGCQQVVLFCNLFVQPSQQEAWQIEAALYLTIYLDSVILLINLHGSFSDF